VPGIVHFDRWVLDQFAECSGRIWNKQVLLSAEVPRLKDGDACPASASQLDGIVASAGLKAVPANDWMFVYPSAWHTRGVPSAQAPATPSGTDLKVDVRVADWKFDGQREIGSEELNGIAARVRSAARPPIVVDAPLALEDGKPTGTIALQIFVDVFKTRASDNESVVAMYGQARGLARLVYGELRNGTYVPLWDSPLFNAALVDFSYHDFDDDGVPEIVLRGRLARDGWLFTAFSLRGVEITRQPVCEPWYHYMGTGRSYAGGGFVCPITGHRDGELEYERRDDGTTDLVGNVWYSTPKGPRRGPVRFTLVKGRYVRDPKMPPLRD
jgi:hypothetical protein